jgi:hypothetical protein
MQWAESRLNPEKSAITLRIGERCRIPGRERLSPAGRRECHYCGLRKSQGWLKWEAGQEDYVCVDDSTPECGTTSTEEVPIQRRLLWYCTRGDVVWVRILEAAHSP